VLATLLAVFALGPASQAVEYRVEGPAEFQAFVQQTLDDPRGWSLGGAVEFRVVDRGGRFVVRLAEPATVASYYACSEWYSCRSGEDVLINAMRWQDGVPWFAGLDEYRRHVINHEVGHALGFGHAHCAVMQQQSKGLQGCRARSWPLASERRALGERLGVRPRPAYTWWTP
jgi:hypothetical protein